MKFKTKLILLNALIIVVIISCICAAVVQGIFAYSLNTSVDKMQVISAESSILITQSIQSSKIEKDAKALYRTGAQFYADEISKIYSVPSILYDTDLEIVSSTIGQNIIEPFALYSFANTVLEEKKDAYVYTSIENVNYIVYFTPIIVDKEVLGVCALYESTVSTDMLVKKTERLFILTGCIGIALCVLALLYLHTKMFKPVKELCSYMSEVTGDGNVDEISIDYRYHDEIRELIDGFSHMLNEVKEKISAIDFEKERLSAVIASMQDAVLAFDRTDRRVVAYNKKVEEYFPSVKKDFLQIPNVDVILDKVNEDQKTYSVEFTNDNRYYLMSASFIPQEDRHNDGILVIIRDISSVKKMEEEQNKFISSVSHELRTPLTTIMGYIDILRHRGMKDEALAQKALSTAKKEAQRLLRLVNDLLNINRMHASDFELIFSNIDPNALIEEAVREMNVKAEKNKLVVMYNASSLPEIYGDYDRLKQVLINVIDNAIKYSNEDSLIKVMAVVDEEDLQIVIRDYGEGIPEDKQEKIFDAFYRVEEDRSRIRGGVGLGLSIVKNIITRHGGSIRVESVVHQGTLIEIRLPIPEVKEEKIDEKNE